jgi:hypothetical protein
VTEGAGAGIASASQERDWWLRTVLVLSAPRAVFSALRDDSDEAAASRAEPVLLVTWLVGMAAVLATPTTSSFMDGTTTDGLLVAIWVFLAGGLYGGFLFWAFGAAFHGGLRALGSTGTYRRARHLFAYAAVPLVLSLALWPVKLALYGDDVFHRGGADGGAGGAVFTVLFFACVAWTLVLLVIAAQVVQRWTWARSAGAIAAAAGLLTLVGVALRAFEG